MAPVEQDCTRKGITSAHNFATRAEITVHKKTDRALALGSCANAREGDTGVRELETRHGQRCGIVERHVFKNKLLLARSQNQIQDTGHLVNDFCRRLNEELWGIGSVNFRVFLPG